MTKFTITDDNIVWREDGSGFDLKESFEMAETDQVHILVSVPQSVWDKIYPADTFGFSIGYKHVDDKRHMITGEG